MNPSRQTSPASSTRRGLARPPLGPARRFLRRSLLGALTLLPALAVATPIKLTIPAQPAPQALQQFIQQSGTQVMFVADELANVRTRALDGEHEPLAALVLMFKDTGWTAIERKAGWFAVIQVTSGDPKGSLRGSLALTDGSPAGDVLVTLQGTDLHVVTDRRGDYLFPALPPGTYVLVAATEGYQPLHVTGITVRANEEVIVSKERLRRGDEITKLHPYFVVAEAVTQLATYEVTGSREKAFSCNSVDLPRTINDVQPYYVFDSQTIEVSGASNIENLLKQQLTMNTTALTNGQMVSAAATYGNTSTINLRGLDTDKTLILVNGRRIATVTLGVNDLQSDINGIPLSSIERIEVLPSSASGIYGGNAIGGVVNIILKRDYSGGEIRASYDNTADSDAPNRTFSVNYGRTFFQGKTNVQLNASWSDMSALRVQDRRELFERTMTRIQANAPNFFGATSTTTPWLGNLPNIVSSSATTNLTLDDGTPLNSRMTYVPLGTSTGTSAAALASGLLANAGKWNMDWPETTQANTGLLRKLGGEPNIRSFSASVRHQLGPRLELFATLNYYSNNSAVLWNPVANSLKVTAASPTNPFQQDVQVRLPNVVNSPFETHSLTRSLTAGAVAKLPWDWGAELDYTHSSNAYGSHYGLGDGTAMNADVLSGTLNLFVDTLRNPPDLEKYVGHVTTSYASTLNDVALRASGPVKVLPWGTPALTFGLERREAETKPGKMHNEFAITTSGNVVYNFYSRKQVADSAYAETSIPLVKKDWLPLLHSLDLQMSGRTERFTVDAGTTTRLDYYNRGTVSYNGVTRNGEPYFEKASYTSSNFTVGLKYQPIEDVTLRASRATAFLPPTPQQLAPSNELSTTTTSVTDPTTGTKYNVYTISGGNPSLTPQSSKSLNLGVIWEPHWWMLKGLRLNAEYYEINQSNAIGTLNAQQVVDMQSLYPGRVTRDNSGAITTVNTSSVNLYLRKTRGWDLAASYLLKTSSWGSFTLRASETIIEKLSTQYSLTSPAYEAAGFHPADLGGAPKYKSTANLVWERRQWTVAWTANYVSSYKTFGSAGGPYSLRFANGAAYVPNSYLVPQGSDHIPGQIYHSAFVSYSMGRRPLGEGKTGSFAHLRNWTSSLLSGVTVQVGVRNIFDREPPLDVYYDSNFYLSPFGDLRLRSYWVNFKKAF